MASLTRLETLSKLLNGISPIFSMGAACPPLARKLANELLIDIVAYYRLNPETDENLIAERKIIISEQANLRTERLKAVDTLRQSEQSASILQLSDENFISIISAGDVVVVKVWRSSCAPCITYSAIFIKAAESMPDRIFSSYHLPAGQSLFRRTYLLGNNGIPVTILFHKGVELRRLSGPLSESQLEAFIKG